MRFRWQIPHSDRQLLAVRTISGNAEPELAPIVDALGTSIKSTRWVRTQADTIVRATNWVWRTPERDIVVTTGNSDMALAETLDPVIDELARTIRLA